MNKTLAITALAVAVSTAVPSLAAADGPRTTSRAYTGGGVAGAGPVPTVRGHGHAQGGDTQAVTVPTARGDRHLRLSIADATGDAVRLEVVQQTRAGQDVEVAQACGKALDTRLPLPGRPVIVYLLTGPCGDGVSTPTTGTVTFAFRP